MTQITDPNATYKLFERALAKKGYTLEFNETPPAVATYVSLGGAKWITRAAHITYPFNNDRINDIALNKDKTYDFALQNKFPVPYTVRLSNGVISKQETEQLLNRYKKLIVKPADSLQGRGLTLDIVSYDQLLKAVAVAKTISPHVLVQQQIEGEEVRFTVMNGKVKVALLRRTPRVVGDGISTIAELIEQENEHRRNIRLERIVYPQLNEAIIKSELLYSTRIPKVGEVVELSKSTMVKGGCSIYNVLDQVDKSYVQAVENLVAKINAGFIVADVFCRDFTTPAADDNFWLIEFNTAPALKLYYACRDGKQYDIVSQLADMIDTSLQR